MPSYWSWYSRIPEYEEMVCVVCKAYPSELGPKSETDLRILEIGEDRQKFGVMQLQEV